MEILMGFFNNVQSKPTYLNHSKTKSIQVCIDSSNLPNIVPAYILNDHNHICNIKFGKETMNLIAQKEDEITRCLINQQENLFFLNDEIKVFSERMYNKCAVCLLSLQGVRINLMIDTFIKMMSWLIDSSWTCMKIQQNVNATSNNLTNFLSSLLAKYDQCNVNNSDYQRFLQQLHQCASSIGLGEPTVSNNTTQSLNITDTSNENDDNDEDENEDEDYYNDDGWYGNRRHDYDDYDEYQEDYEGDEYEDMVDDY